MEHFMTYEASENLWRCCNMGRRTIKWDPRGDVFAREPSAEGEMVGTRCHWTWKYTLLLGSVGKLAYYVSVTQVDWPMTLTMIALASKVLKRHMVMYGHLSRALMDKFFDFFPASWKENPAVRWMKVGRRGKTPSPFLSSAVPKKISSFNPRTGGRATSYSGTFRPIILVN